MPRTNSERPSPASSLPVVRATALALAVAIVPIGCNAQADGEENRQPAEASPVEITRVDARAFRETAGGIGTLEPVETVEIQPEIAAIVRTIHVTEGSTVKKDARLITLDDETIRSALRSRRAALEAARVERANAERKLEQLRDLHERNAATDDELEDAEAAYESAKAEVARLQAEVQVVKAELNDTQIRAPFTGLISEIHVDQGDFVDVGEVLSTMYRTDRIEVAFTVPERAADRLQLGQRVEAAIAAFPDEMFIGEVTFVSPHVRPETRDLLVKATLDNGDGRLKPGMFAETDVIVNVRENRPSVPEESLVATRGGYHIFIVEDGVAKRREVTIGLRKPGIVEIRDGATVGETVVRTGHIDLRDGDRVKRVGNDTDEHESTPEKGA